ncbi:MAG: hypothetical protein GC185_11145 [Alphaproteobacteria bacterium]|nr:hypothetical protein [Alphaproteobacteria bacterium]
MKHRFTKFLMIPVLAALMLGGYTVLAQGAVTINRTVKLTVGKADTVNLGTAASDVLVANPAVADVGSLRSNRLYMVGKSVGDTNVLAFDEQGNQLANINIQVRVDEQTLRDTLHEFFPKENISIHTVNDSIILKGEVSTPSVANQVRDLIGRFVKTQGQSLVDLMTVEGEQQVMLKVKVLEANRNVLREYGFDTDYKSGSSKSNFSTNGGVGLTALTQFASGKLYWNDTGKFGPLQVALQGLERDGLVNTLAEPTLTAISGETAGFLAGGEYPVPAGRDSQGNVSIEFKQFGVSLNFSPTVMESERISLQLSTEVSEKSDTDSVTLQNTIIPGLTVRRAQTTVQIGSGGTLMIAGLLKSSTVDSMNGFPGLKDLPIIGELFKSKSFQRGESELVILVTPYIVQPYAQASAERVQTGAADGRPQSIIETSAPAPSGGGTAAPVSSPVQGPAVAPHRVKKAYYAPQGDQRTAGVSIRNAGPLDGDDAEDIHSAAEAKPLPQLKQWGSAPASGTAAAAPVTPVTAEHIAAPQPAPVKKTPVGKAAVKEPAAKKEAAATPSPKPAAQATVKERAVAVEREAVPSFSAGVKDDRTAGMEIHAARPLQASQADPLSYSFMRGLKKVYGRKAPTGLGGGAGYGYIVD